MIIIRNLKNEVSKDLKLEIEEKDGKLVVSSRVIARELGKSVSDVNKRIEDIKLEIIKENNGNPDAAQKYFIQNTFKAGNNREYNEYLLTKDGFTLYMFNIQGCQEFKMKYINEFNERGRIIEELKKEKTEKISIKDKCLLNIINAKSETGKPATENIKMIRWNL